jgi:hypothetical protein
MKIPSLRSRAATARRAPLRSLDAPVAAAVTTADGVSNSAIGGVDTRSVNDARATAGRLTDPEPHPEGCACLRRPTEQSGEVHCHGGPRAGEVRLAPARPLTGFFQRPGYVPPKVIVSELLDLPPDLDIMLLELDRPGKTTLSGLDTDEVAAKIASRKTLSGLPTGEVAARSASKKTLVGLPTDEVAAKIAAAVSAATAEQPRPSFQPPARVRFEPLPRRPPPPADDDIVPALEDFGFDP